MTLSQLIIVAAVTFAAIALIGLASAIMSRLGERRAMRHARQTAEALKRLVPTGDELWRGQRGQSSMQ